jgi:hypothetical protein
MLTPGVRKEIRTPGATVHDRHMMPWHRQSLDTREVAIHHSIQEPKGITFRYPLILPLEPGAK